MHADQKLYLVFEFLDVDLKRYMEAGNSQGTPLSLELCQVCVCVSLSFCVFLFVSPPPGPRANATLYAMPMPSFSPHTPFYRYRRGYGHSRAPRALTGLSRTERHSFLRIRFIIFFTSSLDFLRARIHHVTARARAAGANAFPAIGALC